MVYVDFHFLIKMNSTTKYKISYCNIIVRDNVTVTLTLKNNNNKNNKQISPLIIILILIYYYLPFD